MSLPSLTLRFSDRHLEAETLPSPSSPRIQLPQADKFGEASSRTTNPSPRPSRLVKSASSGKEYFAEVSNLSRAQRDRRADSMLSRIRTAARAHAVPENRDGEGEGDEFDPIPGSPLNDIPPFRGSKTHPTEFGGQGRLAPSLGRVGAEEGVELRDRMSAARALIQWQPVGGEAKKSNEVRSSSTQSSV